MADSPISAVLDALTALDAGAVSAMFAPDGTILRSDGRVARGTTDIDAAIAEFLGQLRAARYTISAEWNPEPNVWIAQLTAEYELTDYSAHGPYPRAFILRQAPAGIAELSIYGAHEQPLRAGEGYREVRGAGGWMPTL